MEILSSLNPPQRAAVEQTEGALLILAGAGSGKTRVITLRIAYLIAEKGVAPYNILAVTFTNKAAGEMRERVGGFLEGQSLQSAPLIATFHALCVRILRQDIEHLEEGYTKSFTIYDTNDQQKVIKACVKDIGMDEKQLSARLVQSQISASKNRGEDPEMFASRVEYADEKRSAIARVFKLYEERLNNANALDFDDLLIKTVRLLRKSPEVREKYNNKFKYILVDEYQDTNALQFALIQYLTEKQQNICVVGDDAQCLPKGTKVSTPNGYKNIEDITEGEQVLSAGGHSRVLTATVSRVKPNKYKGKLVEITTETGKVLCATPNHILYGKVNPLPEKHFVYLMYQQDKGYRIGRSIGERNSGERHQNMLGLQVCSNQEMADKMWVLRVCASKSEASFYEVLYSNRYGIPTMVFHLKGRYGMSFTQESIDRLYKEIDTRQRAKRIFRDFNLFVDYPHFRPKSRFDANHFTLNLVKFGDGRTSENAPWGGHRLQLGTSERSFRAEFENAGFPCREGRKRTWRMETARVNYADAFTVANRILQIDGRIDLLKKADLVKDRKSFFEFPASHFHAGMSIAVFDGGGITEDTVEKVEFSDYAGEVFDLDIENTHNFISEDFVTHNSIYGFRGADIGNILSFEEHYPKAKVIMLEQNYRSTQTILDAADAIISNNEGRKEKKLWTNKDGGEKIFYYQAFDADNEARFVASRIEEHQRRTTKDKIAVLYRTNAQSRVFEDAFRRLRIDYNIVGGFSFYERAEVKDVIAYLKLVLNPFDDVALLRVVNTPPRGLGKTSLDELSFRARDFGVSHWEALNIITAEGYEQPLNLTPRALEALRNFKKSIEKLQVKASERSQSDKPVTETVIAAIEDSGYANMLRAENTDESATRLENLEELVNAAVDYDKQEENGLRDFIDHAALSSDMDKFDRNATVTLMTVHSAKGLEFPVVFLVGLEDGIFPHSRSVNDPKELEEERRLAYVAITRAERVLYVTHAMRRRVYGEEMTAEPSQFLNEMPLDLIQDLSRGSSWLSYAKSSTVKNNKHVAGALRGEAAPEKPKNLYTGKTYNNADAIAEFFKKKSGQPSAVGGQPEEKPKQPSGFDKLKALSKQSKIQNPKSKTEDGISPGSHVRHAKYGKGLVLRREGAGDNVKLTISFPGFGQKKLIEKFANLEKA
ncbi:MAG TPA: 3'-5' exonuclease [Pyrinomonadaceae bacterium]|nr:3'-5' exonuclease [Pyrinomonadaceae bacterium]